MGLITLEMDVANPSRIDETRSLEFLVDSGAVYSVVPRAILDQLAIRPIAHQEFRLANGTGGASCIRCR